MKKQIQKITKSVIKFKRSFVLTLNFIKLKIRKKILGAINKILNLQKPAKIKDATAKKIKAFFFVLKAKNIKQKDSIEKNIKKFSRKARRLKEKNTKFKESKVVVKRACFNPKILLIKINNKPKEIKDRQTAADLIPTKPEPNRTMQLV